MSAKAPRLEWRKSSHSGSGGCVEVAPTPDGGIAIRDSKHPKGPALTFSAQEWQAFMDGARNGEFDHMS